jgi:hypothetical protein
MSSAPRLRLEDGMTERVVCDLRDLPCDVAVVDAMARIRLRAMRVGKDVGYRDPCEALRELVELIGLGEVLLGSEVVSERKIEEREDPSGIEEERDP